MTSRLALKGLFNPMRNQRNTDTLDVRKRADKIKGLIQRALLGKQADLWGMGESDLERRPLSDHEHPGQAAILLVREALAQFDFPHQVKLAYRGMRRASGHGQHHLRDGVIHVDGEFASLSGHKHAINVPIVVHAGYMVFPEVFVDESGAVQVMAQSAFDEMLRRGNVYKKQQARSHMFSPHVTEPVRLEDEPQVGQGIFNVQAQAASKRMQLNIEAPDGKQLQGEVLASEVKKHVQREYPDAKTIEIVEGRVRVDKKDIGAARVLPSLPIDLGASRHAEDKTKQAPTEPKPEPKDDDLTSPGDGMFAPWPCRAEDDHLGANIPGNGMKPQDVIESKRQYVQAREGQAYNYSQEEMDTATSTSRGHGGGAVGRNPLTYRPMMQDEPSVDDIDAGGPSILDYGAGKGAVNTQKLLDKGYAVTAYDFEDNMDTPLHDPKALQRTYDIVIASNVLNVQSTRPGLEQTLAEIEGAVGASGEAIFNLPQEPRKLQDLTPEEVQQWWMERGFEVERIGGTKNAPVMKAVRVGTEKQADHSPHGLDPAERDRSRILRPGAECKLSDDMQVRLRGGSRLLYGKGTEVTVVRDMAGDGYLYLCEFPDRRRAPVRYDQLA